MVLNMHAYKDNQTTNSFVHCAMCMSIDVCVRAGGRGGAGSSDITWMTFQADEEASTSGSSIDLMESDKSADHHDHRFSLF